MQIGILNQKHLPTHVPTHLLLLFILRTASGLLWSIFQAAPSITACTQNKIL